MPDFGQRKKIAYGVFCFRFAAKMKKKKNDLGFLKTHTQEKNTAFCEIWWQSMVRYVPDAHN